MVDLEELFDLDSYDKGEPLFLKTLEISRRVFGEEHRSTLKCMFMLGALYSAQGRYEEAEPLVARALEIAQRALGEDDPDAVELNRLLVKVYEGLGEPEKAEQWRKRLPRNLEKEDE